MIGKYVNESTLSEQVSEWKIAIVESDCEYERPVEDNVLNIRKETTYIPHSTGAQLNMPSLFW